MTGGAGLFLVEWDGGEIHSNIRLKVKTESCRKSEISA